MSVDHVYRLRDGRSMSYAQYGDPTGFPIVCAHGGLASRLYVEAGASIAEQSGVRLISPDRPGVGRSDPQPGRTLQDWVGDVVELLDFLAVDRFGATGWSLGGQYAAALGYALPSRVTGVAIVAGAIPLTEPGAFDCLPAMDRNFIRLSQRAPWLARLCFRAMGFTAAAAPNLYGRLAARSLGAADGAVLRADGYDMFARMTREAVRQPQGVVEEYEVMIQPWGFAPEDLRVPVDVWGGTDDELLDPHWPPELANRIPNATLYLRPGGHFLGSLYYREIFEGLRR